VHKHNKDKEVKEWILIYHLICPKIFLMRFTWVEEEEKAVKIYDLHDQFDDWLCTEN
jgi:hypothetical protein